MIALIVMVAMMFNRDQLLVRIELDETLRQQNITLVIDGTTYAARDLGPSIRMKPGPHTFEVRRGNEQFKSEQFTIFQSDKPLFRVKADGGKLSVERADPGKEVQILAGVLTSSPAQRSWHGWPVDAPLPAVAPFTAEQAQRHQNEWAAYLKVPVEWENSIGMKFRLIPPGEFLMGSTPGEIAAGVKAVDSNDKHWQECIKSESPQHKVILTQPIYLGANEVTQAEYEKVMGVNPSHFAPMGTGKEAIAGMETANHPVEQVSWDDAAEFCAKLSQQEKRRPFYFRAGKTVTALEGTGYRLPSEAEWEFSCRAGTTTKYWIGDKDEDLAKTDWIAVNSGGRTHSTGEFRANPFGLTDIHGNVCEWVDDGWDAANYGQFKEVPAVNPRSPFSNCWLRVVRGGGWVITSSLLCRSSHRYGFSPPHSTLYFGFRVSLPVDAIKSAISQNSQNSRTDTPEYKRFVEWMKSRGGHVGPEFPPDGSLPHMVTLAIEVAFTPEDIDHFRDLPGVQNALVIASPKMTTRDMIQLGKVMEGKPIGGGTGIVDKPVGLDWLKEPGGFINSTGFTFQNCNAKSDQLAPLKNFPKLASLNLRFNSDITDEAIVHLQELKKLAHLSLEGTGITEAGLARLRAALPDCEILPKPTTGLTTTPEYKRFVEWIKSRGGSVTPEFPPNGELPQQVHVHIDGTFKKVINDADLENFKDLPGVSEINIRAQSITSNGMVRLGQLMQNKPLSSIHLLDMHLGLDWLREPGGLSEVTWAKFQNVDATNDQLAYLANLPKLETIGLRHNPKITDEGIVHLRKFKNLKSMDLTSCGLTESGIAELRSLLPDCQIDPVPPVPAGVTGTPEFRAFVEWVKSRGGSVNPEVPTNGELPHMVELHIDPAKQRPISDEDIDRFRDLPGLLNGINMRSQAVTTDGLIRLGKVMADKPIGQIFLVDMPVGLDWLREPGGFSIIFGATFQNINAKDEQLKNLKKLSRLSYINLRYNKDITDQSIDYFIAQKSLETVHLDWTGISPAGLARLRTARPELNVTPLPPDAP